MFKTRGLKLNTSRMQRPWVLTCTDDRPSLAHPSNTLKAATCVEWGLFLMQIYPLHVIYTGWNHSCCYRLRLRKTSENSAQSTKILGDANQLKAPAMILQFQHTLATPHHSNTLSELLGATPKVLLQHRSRSSFQNKKGTLSAPQHRLSSDSSIGHGVPVASIAEAWTDKLTRHKPGAGN